jgi:S-layer homology domain
LFSRLGHRLAAITLTASLLAFSSQAAWADDAAAAAAGASAAAAPSADIDRTLSAVTPFPDVPENHWAYQALAQLAQDGLITGYPDGTFKGDRPMTRYETAFLVSQAVTKLKDEVAQGQHASSTDIDALKKLLATFGADVADLQNRVAKLESQTSSLQKQAQDLATGLDATKTEADQTRQREDAARVGILFIEKPGNVYQNVSVLNGGNATVAGAPPGQVIRGGQGSSASNINGTTYQFGPGGLNTSSLGPTDHGINYQVAKFKLLGQVDPRFSYYAQITAQTKEETPTGATTASPGFCTSASTTVTVNCSYQDLGTQFNQNTIALNVEDFYIGYNTPGGFTAQLGRYPANSYGRFSHDGIPLIYGGSQISGANLGFNDPGGRFQGQFFYGMPDVSSYTLAAQQSVSNPCAAPATVVGLNLGAVQQQYSGVNPACSATQTQLGAWAVYYVPSTRTAFGGAYNEQFNDPFAYYDSAAVTCTLAGTARMAMSSALCGANGGTQSTAKAGNYFTAQGTVTLAEAYAEQFFGPRDRPIFTGQIAVARHMGTDPINGGAWLGATALATALTYASKGNLNGNAGKGNPFYPGTGARNSNVAQLFYGRYGLNSVGSNSPINASTTLQNNLGFVNPSGMEMMYVSLGHWFSDQFRLTVGGIHLQNLPGVTIPVGTNGTANSCPGCFVNSINQNELLLESYFSF